MSEVLPFHMGAKGVPVTKGIGMSKLTNKAALLTGTFMAGAMIATPVVAQESTDTEAAATESDDFIVVTGSRIQRRNVESAAPVAVVDAAEFQLSGTVNVENVINTLPQVVPGFTSNSNNPGNGAATLDLRGLGSVRTLVLVNGRRWMSYDTNQIVDLNTIPSFLIDSVDVVTGGASAVYGSDAVAGVVNFIMKDNLEGVQLDAQYGFFQHNNDYDTNGDLRSVIAQRAQTNPSQFKIPEDNVMDGFGKDLTIMMGVNAPDDRGNITAYASYRNNDAVLQGDRDYSACSIGAATANGFTCGGSSTSFPDVTVCCTSPRWVAASASTASTTSSNSARSSRSASKRSTTRARSA